MGDMPGVKIFFQKSHVPHMPCTLSSFESKVTLVWSSSFSLLSCSTRTWVSWIRCFAFSRLFFTATLLRSLFFAYSSSSFDILHAGILRLLEPPLGECFPVDVYLLITWLAISEFEIHFSLVETFSLLILLCVQDTIRTPYSIFLQNNNTTDH